MFVTRTRFDAMERRALDAEVSRDTAWKLVAQGQAMWQDLFAKYHALKMAGGTEPAPAPKALERKKEDPVAEVIADVAGNNAALRRQLGAYARAEKRKGTPVEDITHALLNWEPDEDGTAE